MTAMAQPDINDELWSHGDARLVREYRRHAVRPVERLLVDRYATELSASVLEIGVGGGRLTELLVALGGRVTGIDVSEAMVANCARRFPAASFLRMDLRDLSTFGDASFAALLAGYNVLDVLAHEPRGEALAAWSRVLTPGGLLIYSSHNLHHAGRIADPRRIISRNPVQVARNLRGRRSRIANHARLAPQEQHGDEWAVLNDEAHDHSLLHYYATRDENERRLAEHGFALVECVGLDGRAVDAGETAAESAELHYVARRASS